MGKTKRQRQKLHLSAVKKPEVNNEPAVDSKISHPSPLLRIEGDIFKDIDFSIDTLATRIDDDCRSVKSFKSVKSVFTDDNNKIMPKKDKLKLRREIFLKKMDSLYQLKKGNGKKKLKKQPVVLSEGAQLLKDSLPSLQSLLHTADSKKVKPTKQKGIQKAKKRKNEMIKEIKLYKKALSDERFKTNSLAAIAEHIKTMCQDK